SGAAPRCRPGALLVRLAIIAAPAAPTSHGALDGDALRARLSLQDTGFEICDLDPTIDLAEQLDALFDRKKPSSGDDVLFYASCRAVLSSDGEFFLCLDPHHPETGDSLADIANVFLDWVPGRILFILECRHPVNVDDPFAAAGLVGAAKDALKQRDGGI